MPLKVVPNISVNIEFLPLLEQWAMEVLVDVTIMPKPSSKQLVVFKISKIPIPLSLIKSQVKVAHLEKEVDEHTGTLVVE